MSRFESGVEISGGDGFSLIELMIAMAVGSIIAAALVVVFIYAMNTNREQFRAAQQIENGRFAIDQLVNDLRLAGYYGEFTTLPAIPAALPDPCTVPAQDNITEATASPFGNYVQGYAAADLTSLPTVPASCSSLLTAATLRAGSDIVVVRRLETKPLLDPPVTAASVSSTSAEVYAQTTSQQMSIQHGSGAALDGTKNATGAATGLMLRKDFSQPTVAGIRPTTAAYIRKVHVHVYFVANCKIGSGADGQCTATDNADRVNGIPTLKRLELVAASGTQKMQIVPLAEGIEFLKVRYGLDTASTIAGKTVDGSVDSLVPAASVALADWQNVVLAEVRVLAMNSEASTSYSDTKSYDLGGVTYTPSGALANGIDLLRFKRHAFTSQVYIMNVGGRRES